MFSGSPDTTEESDRSDFDTSNDVNIDSQTESDNDTALTISCTLRKRDLVKLLLSYGADIEHRNKEGWTPLLIAVNNNFHEIVEILLDHNANIEVQRTQNNFTPLSIACVNGNYEVCESIIFTK